MMLTGSANAGPNKVSFSIDSDNAIAASYERHLKLDDNVSIFTGIEASRDYDLSELFSNNRTNLHTTSLEVINTGIFLGASYKLDKAMLSLYAGLGKTESTLNSSDKVRQVKDGLVNYKTVSSSKTKKSLDKKTLGMKLSYYIYSDLSVFADVNHNLYDFNYYNTTTSFGFSVNF